jgi:antitoxin (DNA-binding transcriptional repressor) of toxin-antitoxin stability system
MTQREPIMKSVSRDDIQHQIEQLLSQVAQGDTQVSVEEQGKTVAAIISGSDLVRLRRYDREVAEGEAILKRMRQPFRDVDPEQIERDVAAVIEEVRREQAATPNQR